MIKYTAQPFSWMSTKRSTKLWHQGLLLKIKQTLPPVYFNLLNLTYKTDTSRQHKTTNLPPPHFQCFRVFGCTPRKHLMFITIQIYTADIPQSEKTILSTFADDTVISTTHPDPTLASVNLQDKLQTIENWNRNWRLKINDTKSSHITFTLRRGH